MKDHTDIIKWSRDYLISKEYVLERAPEIVLERPWSTVIRFSTSKGNIYLKQTPKDISLEPKIIERLNQFHSNVPIVIAMNDDLHCFLMKDGGQTLRLYLKSEFQADLLYDAIRQFTTIQRSTENHIDSFFALGVPDWRLDKIPVIYDQILNQTEFLREEGITEEELKQFRSLRPRIEAECRLLSRYHISETVVQPDFNTNNVLFNSNLKKMTFIDWGEIVIAHPFFSLHNFLLQAIIHHEVEETDPIYSQLQSICLEKWLDLTTEKQLIEAFSLSKKLWPIYSALAFYRLMMSVDSQALKSFYVNKPNQFAEHLREYAIS